MMNEWFECSVRYEKTLENGMQKYVSEPYLIEAISFTEAEQRFIEEIQPFISGEFAITGINRAHYAEVFFDYNGERWFKVRLHFITLDEKNGMEKRTLAKMLVQASNVEEALENFKKGMKGTMADYVIIAVSETQLMDVFPYEAGEGGTE